MKDTQAFLTGKRLALFALITVILDGCGGKRDQNARSMSQPSTSDQAGQSEVQSTEDVVQSFQVFDSLADQPTSAADLATRQQSLMTKEQLKANGAPLVVDSSLSLAATDVARDISDLRSFDTGIRDQGSRGWCTSFATIAAIENLANRIFGVSLDLSEAQHFLSYHVFQTVPSLNAAKSIGIVDESVWPYYGSPAANYQSKIRAKLGDSLEIKATMTDVIAAVQQGFPVIFNLDVNNSFMNPKVGGIVVPGSGFLGGHAIAATAVVVDARVAGGGYFVIKNSWGANYGDHGYAYVPFDYCRFSDCWAWSVKSVVAFDDSGKALSPPAPAPVPVPVPVPAPAPAPAPSPSDNQVITQQDFSLVALYRPMLRANGAKIFALIINGKPQALQAIASITYRTRNNSSFTVKNRAPAGARLTPRVLMSRLYQTLDSDWTTDPATITLKDGRTFEIPGVLINW